MKKSPTAIICLSHHGGGMELDALKNAQLLSSISDVVLVAKSDTFITKQYALKKESYKLEHFHFGTTLSLSIVLHVRSIVKRYAIKNIIFFGASELKAIYFALLGLDINLIIRHGTTKSTPKKDFFHTLIYSRVNYHIALGEHLAKNIKKIIPLAKGSTLVIIPPSFSFASPLPKKSGAKLKLLHVGRIVRGKGQLDAIEACEILHKAGIAFEFTLVGAISEKFSKEFEGFLAAKEYRDAIKVVGFSLEVERYIQEADIFLYPSYGEGFGNAFIEAMGQNVVGIAYENSSFVDFKNMGLFFLTCKDRDIDALSKTLLDVAENIRRYQKESAKNHALLQQRFSKEVELQGYEKILR